MKNIKWPQSKPKVPNSKATENTPTLAFLVRKLHHLAALDFFAPVFQELEQSAFKEKKCLQNPSSTSMPR
jgi:hypothetical protein